MSSKPKLHRVIILVLGGLSFFLLAASDPQCARVDDRVTAPDGSTLAADGGKSGGVSECVRACVDAAKLARDAEKDLHKARLDACGDRECRDREEARHEAAMEQIAQDERECKRPCHEQGGGRGGE
jgi:hypothetical protein